MALPGWDASKRIAISIPPQSEALSDYPLLVNIFSASGVTDYDCTAIFSELGGSSFKIAVEIGDTGVQCPVEVERWSAASLSAQLWIKVSLSSTATTTLYLWYDSSQSDNTTYVGALGSKGVLCSASASLVVPAEGTDEATSIIDLTGKTITRYGNTHIESDAHLIGSTSVALDGSGDYCTVPYSSAIDLATSDWSLVIGLRPTHSTNVSGRRIMAAGGGTVAWNSTTGIHWLIQILPTGALSFGYWSGSASVGLNTVATLSLGQWNVIGIAISGSTVSLLVNGAVESFTLSTRSRPTTNPILSIGTIPGEAGGSSTAYTGYIDSLILEKGVGRSSAWLGATYLNYTDQLATYGSPTPALAAVSSAIVGMYSLVMDQAIVGRYGDAAQLISGLIGRYGNASMVTSALVGRYADVPQVLAALEGRYHLMHASINAMDGRYALCWAEVLSGLQGHYDLRQMEDIEAALEGYYSLSASASVQDVACVVVIGGVDVKWASVSWTISEDAYLIEASITLRDQAEFAAVAKLDTCSIVWQGTPYNLFVAAKLRTRSVSGQPGSAEFGADYVIVARSLTAGLDAPYALPLSMEWPVATLASEIAADLVAVMAGSVGLVFDLEDWLQPGGTFFVTDETPLSGLRKLAEIIGGIIQTSPGGDLILRPADGIAPAKWMSTEPQWIIEDSGIFSDAESEQQTDRYNVVTVTNQGETAESVRFETEDLSEYRKLVKGYRTPWVDFGLMTSGGAWVTIEDEGVVEEEVTETVEFVDGSASASYPIYSHISVSWLQTSLGAVTGAEDGSLTSAVSGCSMAEIIYTTRYHSWIGTSDRDETVQFYQVEL